MSFEVGVVVIEDQHYVWQLSKGTVFLRLNLVTGLLVGTVEAVVRPGGPDGAPACFYIGVSVECYKSGDAGG
jgi:hypothetical protein